MDNYIRPPPLPPTPDARIIDYTSDCCERKYYAPGQFCNNKKLVVENKQIFERNFPSENLDITYMNRPQIRCCNFTNKSDNIFPVSCNYIGKCKENENKPLNPCNKSIFNPGKGTFSGYAVNINDDSILKGLEFDNSKCPQCKWHMKLPPEPPILEVDDVQICGRPYPRIAIKNSYPSCDLPNGFKDCNRNVCLNSKPFQTCFDEKGYNKKKCNRKSWSEYSRIENINEDMIESTRFYTDRNTLPFILNHVAVQKPEKCFKQYCDPLFNLNTSANAIDGKCLYDNLTNYNKYKANYLY
jgi:hypothetical protein